MVFIAYCCCAFVRKAPRPFETHNIAYHLVLVNVDADFDFDFSLLLQNTTTHHLQYSCEIEDFAGTQKFKLCATPGVLRDEHVLIKGLGWWLPLVLARTEGQEGDSKAFSLQLPCAWKILKPVLTGVQSAGCGTDHRFHVYLIPGMYLG